MATAKILVDGAGIDLTLDTVTPNKLLSGEQAHDSAGEIIVGTIEVFDPASLPTYSTTIMDTAGGTANASDIASGKIAFVNGNRIVGTSSGGGGITPTGNIVISNPTGTTDVSSYATATISGGSNIVSTNIRSGVTIMGVTGNSKVVNTNGGTIVASDVAKGKVAYSQGSKVTGTGYVFAPNILSLASNGANQKYPQLDLTGITIGTNLIAMFFITGKTHSIFSDGQQWWVNGNTFAPTKVGSIYTWPSWLFTSSVALGTPTVFYK